MVLIWAAILFGSALGLFLAAGFLGPFVGVDVDAVLAEDVWDWRVDLVVLVLFTVLTLTLTYAWWRFGERRSSASVGLPRRGLGRVEGVWLAAGAGWGLVLALVLGAAEGDGGLLSAMQTFSERPAALLGALLLLLPVCGLAALAEEVVFRGWLLTAVSARAGVGPGVAVSSVLFALAHFFPSELADPVKWISFAAYVVAGATFAAISLKQGHLYGATAFHAGFNSLLLLGALGELGLEPSRVMQEVIYAERGTEEPVSALVWLALEVSLLVLLLRTRFGAGRLTPAA